MAKKSRKNKVRAEFKKNYQGRRRTSDLTRKFQQDSLSDDDQAQNERLTGKGELTRHRTVVGDHLDGSDKPTAESGLLRGLVLRVHGLECVVETDDGREYRCAVRQVLKSLSTHQRHVVAAGDNVTFRAEGEDQGIIISVGTRDGVLSRTSRGRQHVLVANVDQLIIVASAAEPDIKPHLIDRFLITAEQASLVPLIVINKMDLVDPAEFQPLIGVYARMGYQTLLTSADRGWGIAQLRSIVAGHRTVVSGQSGVGKSSLLNAIQSGLGLRVQKVSSENAKGKHTTTTAELLKLNSGGYLVDTPGIRQFALWDIEPREVAGLFRDIRPFVDACRFPDCTHIHEVDCAVLDALADGRIDPRRYNSYAHLIEEPESTF
ncbi:MAG: ribosome small subunit-dependent GTPase A [Aureliella sp.]